MAQSLSQLRLVMAETGEACGAWCQAEDLGVRRLITRGFGAGRWETRVECLELGHEPVREFSLNLGPDGRVGLLAVHQSPLGSWVTARLRHRGGDAPVRLVEPSPQACASPHLRLSHLGASAPWTQGVGQARSLMLAEI